MVHTAPEALLAAIRAKDRVAVRQLLDEAPARAAMHATGGESLVLHAVYAGAMAVVPELRRNRLLDTCEAAALGDLDALRDALARDSDACARRSGDGWTALHLAAFFGHDEAAARLLDHGAPLDAYADNATRNTPLHAALAGACSSSIVRRLIVAGADVTAHDAHHITPLHLAASRGDTVLCDLLLAHGADPQATMDDGNTPASLAIARGFAALGERLGVRARAEPT